MRLKMLFCTTERSKLLDPSETSASHTGCEDNTAGSRKVVSSPGREAGPLFVHGHNVNLE